MHMHALPARPAPGVEFMPLAKVVGQHCERFSCWFAQLITWQKLGTWDRTSTAGPPPISVALHKPAFGGKTRPSASMV